MAQFAAAGHWRKIGTTYLNLDHVRRLEPVPYTHGGISHYEAYDCDGERIGMVESLPAHQTTLPNPDAGLVVLLFGRATDCGTNGVWVTRLPILAWHVTVWDGDDYTATPITCECLDDRLWAIESPAGRDTGHDGRYLFPNDQSFETLEQAIVYAKTLLAARDELKATRAARLAEATPQTA